MGIGGDEDGVVMFMEVGMIGEVGGDKVGACYGKGVEDVASTIKV